MISAAVSISPLWYISRSAGYVGLVLLGLIGILGIVTAGNLRNARGTKFFAPELHRSLSLLAIVVLGIHVGAAVADKYSFIGVKDIVIPFGSAYRPLWVGLGAVAVDLGVAVIVTSLIRIKLGYRGWKMVHWVSYPIFALSILHGLGSGTDTSLWFSKLLYLVVVGSLVLAIIARLIARQDRISPKRIVLLVTSFAVPLAILIWAISGPFQLNWPARAQGGIKQAALTSASITKTATGSTVQSTHTALAPLGLNSNYVSNWSGKVDQSPANGQGEIALRLMGSLSSSPNYLLSVVLIGVPLGGGVSMTSSLVEIAANDDAVVYKGSVIALNGTTFVAQVADATGKSTTFSASINLGTNGSSFTATIAGSAAPSFSNGAGGYYQQQSESRDQ